MLTHGMLTLAREAGTVNILAVLSRKRGAEWSPKSPGTTQLGSAGVGTSIPWNPVRRCSKMLKVVISGTMPCLISFLVPLYFEDVV